MVEVLKREAAEAVGEGAPYCWTGALTQAASQFSMCHLDEDALL